MHRCLVFCDVSPNASAPNKGNRNALFPCLKKLPDIDECFLQYSVAHPGPSS